MKYPVWASLEVMRPDERARIGRAAESSAAAVFTPLAWGVAGLHLLFAVADLFLPRLAAVRMWPLDLLALAGVAALGFARARGMPARHGVVLLVALNVPIAFARLIAGDVVFLAAPLLLLQVGAGALVHGPRALLLIQLSIALGWGAVSGFHVGDRSWLPWHFVLASGAVIAFILERARHSLLVRAELQRASLEESEARYRALVESSPDGICVLIGGRIVFANAAAGRIFGASSSKDLLGRVGVALIAPESAALVHARNRAVESEGVVTEPLEVTGRRLDGGSVDLEIWGMPVLYEGRHADLSLVRDMTERRRAREHEERLLEVSAEQAVTRDLVRRMLSEARRGASMRNLGRSLAQDVPATDLDDYMRAFEAMGFGRVSLRVGVDGRYELSGHDLLERRAESAQPTCDLALGFLEGAVSRLEGADVLGTETRCQSQGHEACTFVVRTRRAVGPAVELPQTLSKRS